MTEKKRQRKGAARRAPGRRIKPWSEADHKQWLDGIEAAIANRPRKPRTAKTKLEACATGSRNEIIKDKWRYDDVLNLAMDMDVWPVDKLQLLARQMSLLLMKFPRSEHAMRLAHAFYTGGSWHNVDVLSFKNLPSEDRCTSLFDLDEHFGLPPDTAAERRALENIGNWAK